MTKQQSRYEIEWHVNVTWWARHTGKIRQTDGSVQHGSKNGMVPMAVRMRRYEEPDGERTALSNARHLISAVREKHLDAMDVEATVHRVVVDRSDGGAHVVRSQHWWTVTADAEWKPGAPKHPAAQSLPTIGGAT